jgi:hypothetical protein
MDGNERKRGASLLSSPLDLGYLLRKDMRQQGITGFIMRTHRLIPIILIILLPACDGDGIGGSNDGPWIQETAVLDVSDSSIDIVAHIDDGDIAYEYLEATVTDLERDLGLEMEVQGTTLVDVRVSLERAGNNSYNIQFELEFVAPEWLGLGNHSDSLKIYVCSGSTKCAGALTQINGSPFTVDINYEVVGEPAVYHVTPYVGKPGTPREVSIRGVGFSLLGTPSVKFGTADAVSMEVVNDREITAEYPALTAGEYTVSVYDNGVPIATEARLVLTDEPDFSYAFITRDSIKTKIIYDAERKALLVLTPHTDTMERYVYSSGAWNYTVSNPVNDIQDFALTPDGRNLMVTSTYQHQDNDGLLIFDPATLNLVSMVTYPAWMDPEQSFISVAAAGDGRALLRPAGNGNQGPDTYLFSYRTGMFLAIPGTNWDAQVMGVSGDGRYIISRGDPELMYDARTGQIQTIDIFDNDETGIRALTTDYDGDTVVIGGGGGIHVYQSGVKTGTITPQTYIHEEHNAFAVSADGSRLYVVDYLEDDVNSADRLRIFDLTSPDGSGGFSLVASSTLGFVNMMHGRLAPVIAIGPEEKTLFIASEEGVLIYPIP